MNESLITPIPFNTSIYWTSNVCSNVKTQQDYFNLLDSIPVTYKRTENLIFNPNDEGFSVRYGDNNQAIKDYVLWSCKNFITRTSTLEITCKVNSAQTYGFSLQLHNKDFSNVFSLLTIIDVNYPNNSANNVFVATNNNATKIATLQNGWLHYKFNIYDYNSNADFSLPYLGCWCQNRHYWRGYYGSDVFIIKELIVT